MSENITKETAIKVAVNWLNNKSDGSFTSDSDYVDVNVVTKNGDTTLFVIKFKPQGWAIVSGNDALVPILGYSCTSTINENDTSSPLPTWIGGLSEEVVLTKEQNSADSSTVKDEWNLLINSSKKTGKRVTYATAAVDALLKTQWGQGRYYNDLTPLDNSSLAGNGHTLIGCLGTAMAQIMKYWSFPSLGQGSNSYTYNNTTLSADFGKTTYSWENMPNKATAANNALATANYHCAVSVNTQFGGSGSGAQASAAVKAFPNYFKYNTTISYLEKERWDNSEWIDFLKRELDNKRPVLYSGFSSNKSSGHGWVCDGYEGDYFHFNWGWEGNDDGLFLLYALTPVSQDFSYNQAAIFGIEPITVANITYPFIADFETVSDDVRLFGLSDIVTETPHLGSKCLRLSKESFVSGANNHLSIAFEVPENGAIDFWVKRHTTKASTNNSQSAKIMSLYGNEVLVSIFDGDFNDNGNWVNYHCDLKEFADSTVRLLISQINDDKTNDQWMYVDDIAITQADAAPYKPSNPTPADKAVNVSLTPSFKWSCGDPNNDISNYKLYLAGSLVDITSSTSYTYRSTLLPKTNYYWRVLAIDSKNNQTSSNTWTFTTMGIPPSVETCSVTNITPTSATLCNNITNDNKAEITERGIIYGLSSSLTLDSSRAVVSLTENPSTINIENLNPRTQYFVIAYALSNEGNAFSEPISFTTNDILPTVELTGIEEIRRTSANITGYVSQTNDSIITNVGMIWSNHPGFNIEDGLVIEGHKTATQSDSFVVNALGLPSCDTVFFKMFASCNSGTAYSAESSLVTFNTAPYISIGINESLVYEGFCEEQSQDCSLVDSSLSISDIDGDYITSLSVNLTNPIHIGREYLCFNEGEINDFTIEGDSTNLLTIRSSEPASDSLWKKILLNIRLAVDYDAPETETIRNVEISVSDGIDTSVAASAFIRVISINDAPININPPTLNGTFEIGTDITVTGGLWSDSLDGCNDSVFSRFIIQKKTADTAYVVDIVEMTADSFFIDQSLCTASIRVKEIATDSCGGDNVTFEEAFSEWYKIMPQVQNITFDSLPDIKYQFAPIKLSGIASSQLPLAFISESENISISNDTMVINKVGSATVCAIQTGNECFSKADKICRTFNITKVDRAIEIDIPSTISFDQHSVKIEVNTTRDGLITITSNDTSIAKIENDSLIIKAVGMVIVSATQAATDIYDSITVSDTIFITKGLQAIEIQPLPDSIVFGGEGLGIKAIASSKLEPVISVIDSGIVIINDGYIEAINVGQCRIAISQPGNETWEAATPKEITLTVVKGQQNPTISIIDSIRFCDGPIYAEIQSISDSFIVTVSDTSVATVVGNIITPQKAGEVDIIALFFETEHWLSDSTSSHLTITKCQQKIECDSVPTLTYCEGLQHSLNISTSSNLGVDITVSNTEIATVFGNTLTIENAGNTTININQEGDDRWLPTSVSMPLNILKSSQDIDITLPDTITNGISLSQNVLVSSLQPIVAISGNNDIFKIVGDSLIPVKQGSATLHISQPGNQNYLPVDTTIMLTIGTIVDVESVTKLTFLIYPNPAKNVVTVSTSAQHLKRPAKLSIYDVSNREMLTVELIGNIVPINIEDMAPGVYFIVIRTEFGSVTKKLIIKR